MYTMGYWAIKTCHFILDHNSNVSWWILTLLVPLEIGMNYKICNFTLTVSPHYVIKLKPHKTAHFEVSRCNILLPNSKNESMS